MKDQETGVELVNKSTGEISVKNQFDNIDLTEMQLMTNENKAMAVSIFAFDTLVDEIKENPLIVNDLLRDLKEANESNNERRVKELTIHLNKYRGLFFEVTGFGEKEFEWKDVWTLRQFVTFTNIITGKSYMMKQSFIYNFFQDVNKIEYANKVQEGNENENNYDKNKLYFSKFLWDIQFIGLGTKKDGGKFHAFDIKQSSQENLIKLIENSNKND